jgi:hypothetical protein
MNQWKEKKQIVKDGPVKKNNRKRWISEKKKKDGSVKRKKTIVKDGSVKKTIVKDGSVKRKKNNCERWVSEKKLS